MDTSLGAGPSGVSAVPSVPASQVFDSSQGTGPSGASAIPAVPALQVLDTSQDLVLVEHQQYLPSQHHRYWAHIRELVLVKHQHSAVPSVLASQVFDTSQGTGPSGASAVPFVPASQVFDSSQGACLSRISAIPYDPASQVFDSTQELDLAEHQCKVYKRRLYGLFSMQLIISMKD